MSTNIAVSFCVPVYNNSLAACEIVNDLLTSDNQNFELVICDDASDDDSQELLSGIHDHRFKYYRNDENLGFRKNWLHTLELGSGEYLYFAIGRDRLHGENINKLIKILSHARENNIMCLKDTLGLKRDVKIYRGIHAMMRFIDYGHPTGMILSREKFHAIHNRSEYFRISDIYPENYIMRDILLDSYGASINSGIYRGEMLIDQSRIKSTVEHGTKNILDAYYAPTRRTRQFFEQIDMIDELDGKFNALEKNLYFHNKFYTLLQSVSTWWRRACGDHTWQNHYGQEVQQVTMREMISNIITAHEEVTQHLRDKGCYTLTRQALMLIAMTRKIVSIAINMTCKCFCGV